MREGNGGNSARLEDLQMQRSLVTNRVTKPDNKTEILAITGRHADSRVIKLGVQ